MNWCPIKSVKCVPFYPTPLKVFVVKVVPSRRERRWNEKIDIWRRKRRGIPNLRDKRAFGVSGAECTVRTESYGGREVHEVIWEG